MKRILTTVQRDRLLKRHRKERDGMLSNKESEKLIAHLNEVTYLHVKDIWVVIWDNAAYHRTKEASA